MESILPFSVEYAKSGRASCKKCKENIAKDSLRMAIMVQSHRFDGKMPQWHHWKCFFQQKNKLQNVSEIANFDNLRWEDQENIKKELAGGANYDFSVEYAISGKAKCRGCGEKILKEEIRISILNDDPEIQRFGPNLLWRHVDCFVKDKQQLQFNETADKLPGFHLLKAEDQEMVKVKIEGSKGVKRKNEDNEPASEVKVRKTDNKDDKILRKEEKILKEQNKQLFYMRDKIVKAFSKKDIIRLLEHNEQHISTGEQRLWDHLADCLMFGAIKKCPECKSDTPRFLNNTYVCNGHLTEWTRCQYETKYPERKKFDVPEDIREDYLFLKKYIPLVRERKFPKTDASSSKTNLPLSDFKISLFGKFKLPEDVIEKKLEELGAKLQNTVNKDVNLCISTLDEVESESSEIEKARTLDIHVVSYGFVHAVLEGSPVAQSIKDNLLSTWGEDPILKFGIKEYSKIKSEAYEDDVDFSKGVSQKIKLTAKGGAAVDPESGLEKTCLVYQKNDDVYNVMLAYVDMSKGTNSFYKIQILKSKKESKYHVFRQWGRVGTTIGGKKVEKFSSDEEAISVFEDLYKEKTGNEWCDRKIFQKKPGCMYPLDIDYGQECDDIKQELKPGKNSKLPKSVQKLICLIFDVRAMKKAMVEFEIDVEKMPLGKLSKNQIELAYKVLGEAQQILTTGPNNTKITDVSNRFFTLIPHDFGIKKPPLLDSEDIIKSKIEMLDSLMEIEFAYNLFKGKHSESKDPIDEHYEKLKTDIEPVPKGSKEFELIQTYVNNTHSQIHDNYKLKIQEVFKINRHGESENYQKFKDLHNKKLLWHGSRITNYVGILSQGLRIAPPEAPVTGYMFGKGVYFADMVSKSANYCFTGKKNSIGLLLLCEVALGDMYERTRPEYVAKLPKNKHSTLGMGMTVPDPTEKAYEGDVEIPYGKPSKRTNIPNCYLLHNEYIVYDTNQINIKYLLKVQFK